jgi:hypothetical protein
MEDQASDPNLNPSRSSILNTHQQSNTATDLKTWTAVLALDKDISCGRHNEASLE